jgi:hypothetical protein
MRPLAQELDIRKVRRHDSCLAPDHFIILLSCLFLSAQQSTRLLGFVTSGKE